MQRLIDSLVGEVLTDIDVDESNEQILLTTESGRQVMVHHVQDCCEEVRIVGTDGEWRSLIGKPLVMVTHEEEPNDLVGEPRTDTALTFRVSDATVISRWVGESNGYYSESVDLCEITKPRSL